MFLYDALSNPSYVILEQYRPYFWVLGRHPEHQLIGFLSLTACWLYLLHTWHIQILFRTLQCLVLPILLVLLSPVRRGWQFMHWMKISRKEDFYGGRTGPLQCEVQRMRSCSTDGTLATHRLYGWRNHGSIHLLFNSWMHVWAILH